MAYVAAGVIEVIAWGDRVGAVAPAGRGYAFEYDPAWIRSGRELAPSLMPLRRRPYVFPGLNPDTFMGLPPMIADSLPGRFGNALVDTWMSEQGIPTESITSLDRLAYLGSRGMGALEFRPDGAPHQPAPTALDLSELVQMARAAVQGSLGSERESEAALRRILQVGTSAGGARAKAIVSFNPETADVRSGHSPRQHGFEAWMLKFDGVGADLQLGTPGGYGRIEYAYAEMARAAGIDIAPTRLLEENGRAHFMTQRFDRDDAGARRHLQSLCGMDALDYNAIATNSYEQLFVRIAALDLGEDALRDAWRRMAFNVAARNHDDHTKNHSFLYTPEAGWSLSPAYDVTYAYNPTGRWTRHHLMSVNGRFDGITFDDLRAVGERFQVPGIRDLAAQVGDAVGDWHVFADAAGVPAATTRLIAGAHDLAALSPR